MIHDNEETEYEYSLFSLNKNPQKLNIDYQLIIKNTLKKVREFSNLSILNKDYLEWK